MQRVGGVLVIVLGLALLGIVQGPFASEHRLLLAVPRVVGPLRPFVVGVSSARRGLRASGPC